MDNLKKEVFDLLPLVGLVHDLKELLHLLLAKADLAFGRIISVDKPQKRARVLVVSVYLLHLSNLIRINILGRTKKLGNIRLIDLIILFVPLINSLNNLFHPFSFIINNLFIM